MRLLLLPPVSKGLGPLQRIQVHLRRPNPPGIALRRQALDVGDVRDPAGRVPVIGVLQLVRPELVQGRFVL
eukprot:CAMPEP_0174290486 /NCGR_PEP_ID=MMETSP0809-20121228/29044_1 /TAXON_ID=73025 ORGANISM="Eutreptiella gymnastica-like, Strain CCMP1594" /NCGR_SAMPLE_ID=MMETSP0809 /ASSEMBLY_ACC=CAM_ASM_000658 /LENGTH=70 /DNA_ID=CAMNT_0015389173 /DNA_START=137 /DNA_END=346 /DNA_ORIENTATION=+